MYKIETHLHTVYSSRCGHLDAEAIVTGYLKAGYHGVVVTDHFNRTTCKFLGIDYHNPLNAPSAFLEGYYQILQEGERRGLRVYKGAEFRFDGSDNDYLVFGYDNRILADPDGTFRSGLPALSSVCRADGALIIQAHPYRNVSTPADPAFLDGIEVLNRNPDWNNHNDWALSFAEKHNLLQTSGSDCHTPRQIGLGGILTDILPESDSDFVRLIRSGKYTLI